MPGTIYGKSDFEADKAAEQLRNSMKGLGTDEEIIVAILADHSNEQRQEIATTYKQAYGKDLIDDLKDELGGDFEEVCLAMMATPRVFDARQINKAISGAGTDESTIVEIMCTRSNEEIEEIKQAYKEEFENELEEDLVGDTSGYFQRLMVSLCAGGRETSEWADEEKAAEDAKKFYEAGEERWGTDEAEMNAVLCLRSRVQLLETIKLFEQMTEKTMEESVEDECSGNLKKGYLAILRCAKSMPHYFARRVKECLEGLGTEDNDLIRIIVSRSEIDLQDVKEAFEEMYEKSLLDSVSDECSGDYKRMLCSIINPYQTQY
ncbi:annexin A4-like [Gigantopelta aegis]|uniref:annexin A4-like n=1 Tax=Gigantopelta aegis TaxID=1735272 RepID=UPI001B88C86F|nr:annexin A4-like [Gigantopelta aegis]